MMIVLFTFFLEDFIYLKIWEKNSEQFQPVLIGGIDITFDGGKNWYDVKHMALAEVYHIGFDLRDPYYVYCGLQDNGSWGGPSATLDPGGIRNSDWYMIGGGDGFFTVVDSSDPDTIYSNWQTNNLYRYNLKIGRSKTIRPAASLKELPYRFNWNSPIYISPHDPKTVYTGGNYLFETTDGGQQELKSTAPLSLFLNRQWNKV